MLTEHRPSSSPGRQSPGSMAGRVAAVVLVAVGTVIAAFLAQSWTVIILVGLALATVVGVMMLARNPDLLVPIALGSMWIEALGVGPITVGRIVAFLVPVVLLARVLTTSWRPPQLMPRSWVPLMGLVTWAWCGAFYAEQFGVWFNGFLILMLGVSYWFVFALLLPPSDVLDRYLRLWTYQGSFIGVLSVIAFFVFGGGEGKRVTGLAGGPNEYAAYIIASLMIMVYLLGRSEPRQRLILFACCGVQVVALGASGSRMGLVLMAAIAAYLVLTYPGLGIARRLWAGVGGMLGGVVFYFLLLIINPDRFSLAGIASDRGAGRLDLWAAGIDSLTENLWFGRALGGFRASAYELLQRTSGASLDVLRQESFLKQGGAESHNLYLTIGIDLGLIGFVLYLGLVLVSLWNLRSNPGRIDKSLSWALFGVLAAVMIGNFFGSQLNNKLQWSIIGIASGLWVRQRLVSTVSERGSPGGVDAHR